MSLRSEDRAFLKELLSPLVSISSSLERISEALEEPATNLEVVTLGGVRDGNTTHSDKAPTSVKEETVVFPEEDTTPSIKEDRKRKRKADVIGQGSEPS